MIQLKHRKKILLYVCCRVFVVVVVGLLVAWLAIDTRKRPEQLISFGGVCLFVIAIFLFSAHRTAVSKKHVDIKTCFIKRIYNAYLFLDFGFTRLIVEVTYRFPPIKQITN